VVILLNGEEAGKRDIDVRQERQDKENRERFMNTVCDRWSEAVDAVDVFDSRPSEVVIFGGVASASEEEILSNAAFIASLSNALSGAGRFRS